MCVRVTVQGDEMLLPLEGGKTKKTFVIHYKNT